MLETGLLVMQAALGLRCLEGQDPRVHFGALLKMWLLLVDQSETPGNEARGKLSQEGVVHRRLWLEGFLEGSCWRWRMMVRYTVAWPGFQEGQQVERGAHHPHTEHRFFQGPPFFFKCGKIHPSL